MERKIYDCFDRETMPDQLTRRIENALSGSRNTVRRPRLIRVAAVAASLTLVLAVFNFNAVQAFAESIISQFFHEPQGRIGRDFVEVRDGRLYFTGNGENMDVTDQCSMETPFIYVSETPSGKIMYMIVGGTPDNWGYMDFTYNPTNDSFSGGGHNTSDPENDYESYPWVHSAVEQLDIPFRP